MGLFRQIFLRQSGTFAQGNYLQSHIPRLTCPFKAGSEFGLFHLLLKVSVKISFAHALFLSSQSHIRSRATIKSRSAIDIALFLIP